MTQSFARISTGTLRDILVELDFESDHGAARLVRAELAKRDTRNADVRERKLRAEIEAIADAEWARKNVAQIEADEAECAHLDAMADEGEYYDRFGCWYGDDDDSYDQRRDEKAERDADARQDR